MRIFTIKTARYTLLAVSGIFLAGCGSTSPNRIAAHKIAEAMPRIVGPAAHYDVTVDGDSGAVTRGRAKRVRVEGVDVQLSPELTTSHLSIDVHDLEMNMRTHALERTGPITFTGFINQENVNAYLAKKRPDITVTLRDVDLQADIPVAMAGIGTTAHLIGGFVPNSADPDKLDFTVNSAKLGLVPIPSSLVNLDMQRANPLLDLSNLKFPVALQRAEISKGQIIVYGTATLGKKD